MSEVATRTLPAYPAQVPAAVLLNEQRVTVDSNGMMTTVTRHAVKILTHEGQRDAEVTEGYEKGGRSVKELRAWLIAPGGFVKTFEKGDVQDLGVFGDELYNDYRVRRIHADNPEIGSVFAYESEVVNQATEAQDRFVFQVSLPELDARYSITLPAGWTAKGIILNHDRLAPQVEGNTYTWSLKNLPYRHKEAAAPELTSTSPMLAIDFQPPVGTTNPPAFHSWTDVAHWYSGIAQGQAEITPEMAAKARELTEKNAIEYERIRALGNYVQKVRYLEIAMDLSHYGGIRPHAASQVFAKQYGDCKDKANLLRALLQAVGIRSYLVVIYSGDRTFVKKDWASPSQFNHMILAIQVSDSVKAPTVMDLPIGRVLIFDPTDDRTPMGDLPFYEQGSYALICAEAKGDLVEMPILPADTNLLTESIQASLDSMGNMTASIQSHAEGQAARLERARHDVSAEKYKGEMERYLDFYAKSALIHKLEVQDDFDHNEFLRDLQFEVAAYAQVMQNRLLIFNPCIVPTLATRFPAEHLRDQPIVLNSRVYHTQISVKLPSDFKVDELPSALHEEQAFGKFDISYRQEAGHLLVDEQLRTEAVTLPASDYPKVKKFFDEVQGASNQSAVLVKN